MPFAGQIDRINNPAILPRLVRINQHDLSVAALFFTSNR